MTRPPVMNILMALNVVQAPEPYKLGTESNTLDIFFFANKMRNVTGLVQLRGVASLGHQERV